MRFATYTAAGRDLLRCGHGCRHDRPVAAVSANWPSLRDVIADQGLAELAKAAAGRAVTHVDFTYQIPIPNPEKILCVGRQFP